VDRTLAVSRKAGSAIVLAVGGALRFWNIADGLPYRIGPDEPVIGERAIHMMRTGSFHPRFRGCDVGIVEIGKRLPPRAHVPLDANAERGDWNDHAAE